MSIWNKYSKIKGIETKISPRIDSYIAKKNFIIKKINFINEEEKMKILGFIESMKNRINIYDIYEEFFSIHIAIDLDNDDSRTFDVEFEKSKKSHFLSRERIPIGQAEYSNLDEIKKLFDKSEDQIFKISFNLKDGSYCGTAFILEIEKKYKLPFKRALFTCNHNINDETFRYTKDLIMENQNKKDFALSLEESIIYTVSKYKGNNREKNMKRKIFSESFNFDYTCIELYEEEFKEKKPYKISNNYLQNKTGNKNKDIYILHYSEGKDLSFSFGKINKFLDSEIWHSASTRAGASGSPIFFREDDSVIGLHYAGTSYHNKGYFIDDILPNIQMIYSSIDEIELIQSVLNEKDFIKQNQFIYKKDIPIKKGEIGNIYFGENKNKIKGVLIIEINLIKLVKKVKQQKNVIYSRLLSFEIESLYNTIKKLDKIIDIYIECNSLHIIIEIENDCMTTLEEFYAEKKKLNKDEIYNLLIRLNENLQILYFSKCIANISLSNILINQNKEYKFLLYYDYILYGNFRTKKNKTKKSELVDIGEIVDYLFKEYKGEEENKIDKKDNLDFYRRFLQRRNEVKKECFLSILIEKIKNQFPWDNYYIECQYNILNKVQKSCIAYISGSEGTSFFCEIKCKEIPIKKAIITPYVNINSESLDIMFIKDNKEIQKRINLRGRKTYYYSNKSFSCIELFDGDGIENFFIIDENFFKGKYDNEQIILFQYLNKLYFEDDIYCSVGNIKQTYGEIINSFTFSAEVHSYGMGAPIVLSKNSNYVIGIYTGKVDVQNLGEAISINYILKTIKDSLSTCLII